MRSFPVRFVEGTRMRPSAIERWQKIVKSRDAAGLEALLADDVLFVSPVVHTPQRGKAITQKYLGAATAVLGGESFRYVGEWFAENSAVLEFVTTIDGVEINGVDIIGWNAEGKIDRFKVMVRPLKTINALHQMMGAKLAGAGLNRRPHARDLRESGFFGATSGCRRP